MKKILRIVSLLLVLTLCAALLAGCSGNKDAKKDTKEQDKNADSPAVGTWKGEYQKLVGDDEQVVEEFSLELTADGKGVHHRDEMEFNVSWELDGENFTMKETFIGDPIVYTGTLKDGELMLYNGDPEDDWTYIYVYSKEK